MTTPNDTQRTPEHDDVPHLADRVSVLRDEVLDTVERGDRSPSDRHLIGGLYVGAAVVGGLGLYFHLDSRAAANDVSNQNEATGPWTAALQSTYDRGHHDGELAEISYGVAGSLLLGAIIATWWTQPKPRTAQVDVSRIPTPVVSPTRNGGVVSAQWDF